MDRSAFVRRAFHLASPVWLVWYWIPPDAWVGVRKEGVLIAVLSGALLVEAARLITGYRLVGMRDYESHRLGAYAWGAIGLAVALPFFPGEFVIPTFWGMAWIDPLAWYTRRRGGYPLIPLAAYAALASVLFLFVVPLAPFGATPVPPIRLAVFVPLATVVAIAVERPNLRYVDDDFAMHLAPLVAVTVASAVV